MSTSQSTIDYILDQLQAIEFVSTRKMFGEYALYCNNKVVGLICDDTLYIKITKQGKQFVGDDYKEGFAYPGAKTSMLIEGDKIEDSKWICELVRIASENLPGKK